MNGFTDVVVQHSLRICDVDDMLMRHLIFIANGILLDHI